MRVQEVTLKQFHNYDYLKPKEEEKKLLVANHQMSKETAEAFKAYAVSSNEITFGYHHPLKTMFLKGELPWLKYGMYGDLLSERNVTIEHIKPVSVFKEELHGSKKKAQKAATVWDNVALASKRNNNGRGSDPLSSVIDWEAFGIYLEQFKGRIIPGFGKGEEYIKGILNRVNSLIQSGN